MRRHTDAHLLVFLIQHNCVHERSSATEYHKTRTYQCLHMVFWLQQNNLLQPCQAVLLIHKWNWVFGRFWPWSNKVFNMWRGVWSSMAKTALCGHGSRTVVLQYGSTKCTHSLMYTSKCPNKTAYTASLLKNRPFSWIFSTLSCF